MSDELSVHHSALIVHHLIMLHETTQRRVCRTAFVVGCVLPTLGTILWIAFLHRPWRENDWQRMLQQRLHVRATIGEIRSPTPGVTQLIDVQFADLRTQQPWGSIGELCISGSSSKPTFVADRIEIVAAQIPAFATAISTWLSSKNIPALQLRSESLSIAGSHGKSVELTNVRLRSLTSGNTHKRIELQAEPPSAGRGGLSSTIQFAVEHHSGQGGPMVIVTLNTQEQHLPAWLLADLVPGLKRCPNARFTGLLQMESFSQTVTGTMSGRLEGIDLQHAIDSVGPHRLQGTASLVLQKLQWRNNRVEVAQGQLRAGVGRVSRSLLDELTKHLLCKPGELLAQPENSAADKLLSFNELACSFQINSAGMTISGACNTGESGVSGCLLASDGQPLLLQPEYRDLQVARLVQVLMPMQPELSWLPASREANAMAEGLPLPGISQSKKK